MLGLDIAYMCAKYDHPSISRSGDMVGAHQNLNRSRDLATPFLVMVCHSGLALATINLSTKFEVLYLRQNIPR